VNHGVEHGDTLSVGDQDVGVGVLESSDEAFEAKQGQVLRNHEIASDADPSAKRWYMPRSGVHVDHTGLWEPTGYLIVLPQPRYPMNDLDQAPAAGENGSYRMGWPGIRTKDEPPRFGTGLRVDDTPRPTRQARTMLKHHTPRSIR
jgi:hypothetical protein